MTRNSIASGLFTVLCWLGASCGAAVLDSERQPPDTDVSTSSSTPHLRIMAGNLTSGNYQAYGDPGVRIFQGLKPDVAMIQEFNYGSDSTADIRKFIDTAFGTGFQYCRGQTSEIPNGVVSRFPIAQCGEWTDPYVSNRDFVWARIRMPDGKYLWAVSLHLLTSSSAKRASEAASLVGHIKSSVPAADYLVLGGDFNTSARTESCISTLSQVVVTSTTAFPTDQNADGDTNASRAKPYDWVVADPDLDALKTTLVIGASSYPNGLVFDSRVYTPISEVAPVQSGDSGATNMQHMAVVRDFVLPQAKAGTGP